MAFKLGEMALLRLSNREQWIAKMQLAIMRFQGNLTHVAQDRNVGLTTIKRWIEDEPALKAYLTKVRAGIDPATNKRMATVEVEQVEPTKVTPVQRAQDIPPRRRRMARAG